MLPRRNADSGRLTTVMAERSVAYRSPSFRAFSACLAIDSSPRRQHVRGGATAVQQRALCLTRRSSGGHDSRWVTIPPELTPRKRSWSLAFSTLELPESAPILAARSAALELLDIAGQRIRARHQVTTAQRARRRGAK